jgi:hypothetical protein
MILCATENCKLSSNFSYDDLIKFNSRILYDKMIKDFTDKINFRINIINEIADIIKARIIDGNSNFNVYNTKIKKEQMILKSLLILFSNDFDSLTIYNLYNLVDQPLNDIKLYIELVGKISKINIIDIIYNFYKYNKDIKIYILDNYKIRIEHNKCERLTFDYDMIINLDEFSSIHNNIVNLIKNNSIIKAAEDEKYKDFILGILYLVLIGIKFEI